MIISILYKLIFGCYTYVRRILCEERMRRNDAMRRDDVVRGICEEDATRRDDSAREDDVTQGDEGTKLCERMIRVRSVT